MSSGNLKIDHSWTLFLDRDGVINRRIVDEYVRKLEEFEFLPGVLDALKILSNVFPRIIIVSNQQGVGKGFMTDQQVINLHEMMIKIINDAGGRIDKVYYCSAIQESNSFHRKPNIGMALSARKDFPGINFKKSIMVGDSLSDMIFGKSVKMKTVFLSDEVSSIIKQYKLIDFLYPDLISFANDLTNQQINKSTNQ